VFMYAFLANALFLVRPFPSARPHPLTALQLRSLRSVVLPDALNTPANLGTLNPAQRRRRITFLFLEAVSQVLYMGILIRV
jgi:protein transport protein YIF1